MTSMKDSARFFRPIRNRRGLSLPEVMISTLLVGVVLVASMKTVGAVFRTRRINAQLGAGEQLAEELMSEILQVRYEDPEETAVPIGDSVGPPGIETGETDTTRADFDDVDDYHQWSAQPPVHKDGTPVAGFEQYERRVTVEGVAPDTLQPDHSFETGMRLIEVTVIEPSGNQIVRKALRSRFGAVEQLPQADTTFVTCLDGELQAGGSPTAANSGTNIINHAEQP
jgi:hypothetical protein